MSNLTDLVVQRHAAAEIEKVAKAVKDLLSKDIEALMEQEGIDETVCAGITVQRIQGKAASKLDEKLLLANGVEADVIKASTVEGKTYTYIQTKAAKV